ncbi:hypothetical protein BKM78_14310 [Tessaracoccus sp. T2.5-30]|nr:hypothetical protein BKM78_14310 [Tessaracoccus sp. T2.5-30]
MYRADKVAAVQGAWRVPESSLHLVSLLGGWPGALVARHAFWHKTRKQPFRTVLGHRPCELRRSCLGRGRTASTLLTACLSLADRRYERVVG